MINLKLAKYNKDGKFQGFLELGKDFLFGRDYILIIKVEAVITFSRFDKDKKDPLNRFNGLFDGLTYREGRFVLIEILNNALSEHDIVNSPIENDGFSFQGVVKKFPSGFGIINQHGSYKLLNVHEEIFWDKIGNLHENPELYEKIK